MIALFFMVANMIVTNAFILESEGFTQNAEIPREYTCKGKNRSPKLSWKGAPKGTKSFAISVIDPDAPGGEFVHWVITDIPPSYTHIDGGIGHEAVIQSGIAQGENSFGRIGFDGPCPPAGKKHRYIFTLYALDTKLELKPGVPYDEFQSHIKGHILSEATLIGLSGS